MQQFRLHACVCACVHKLNVRVYYRETVGDIQRQPQKGRTKGPPGQGLTKPCQCCVHMCVFAHVCVCRIACIQVCVISVQLIW